MRNKKGYTLTEALVVVGLIVILSTSLIVSLGPWLKHRFIRAEKYYHWDKRVAPDYVSDDLYLRLIGHVPEENEKIYYADVVQKLLERERKHMDAIREREREEGVIMEDRRD